MDNSNMNKYRGKLVKFGHTLTRNNILKQLSMQKHVSNLKLFKAIGN